MNRKIRTEEIFEVIFPKLVTGIRKQIQEAQRTTKK